MIKKRIIPSILIKDNKAVKGEKFKNHKYIGDPINIVKIFNDKEVDELVILDISDKQDLNFDLLEKIAKEAFMPISFGGNLTDMNKIKRIFKIGFEKIILNSAIFSNKKIVLEAIKFAGAQSVTIKLDLYYNNGNYFLKDKENNSKILFNAEWIINLLDELKPGEIILSLVQKDGSMDGYDLNFFKELSPIIKVPLIADCGAGNFDHIKNIMLKTEVSGCCASSIFVYYGKLKSVLISYIKEEDRKKIE